jgi:hypothetical protein
VTGRRGSSGSGRGGSGVRRDTRVLRSGVGWLGADADEAAGLQVARGARVAPPAYSI